MPSKHEPPPEHKRRLLNLLDGALERPPGEREAYLDEACADDSALRREVVGMLAKDTPPGLLEAPAFDVHLADAELGKQIGPYRLVRLLDRGGMGTVYLAERDDFDKKVALKLIRRGLDLDDVLVRRFHNERQILARLEHPHIARLLDGGTVGDQLPFFVMEYVEGEPIHRYCERQGLSLRQRLELFLKVCGAVQFAHQNLIVHRDLKPGNILVTAGGEPKLLDFGIAKLLDEGLAFEPLATVTGEGPMTPRYASPEQVRMEPVTTASDVYSLGILLYELLTGLSPYRLDTERPDELARAVCEQDPERPSTAVRRRATERRETLGLDPLKLRRLLSGDLDSILLKALRKEPAERYPSADRLAEDLRRHLDGQPVEARPGTFTYRAGKFVRRYRVALGVGLAGLILVVGAGASWRQAQKERQRAEVQEQQADLERLRAQGVAELLKELFEEAGPDAVGSKNLTALGLLGRIGSLLKDIELSDIDRADLMGTLGALFKDVGEYGQALTMMEGALRFARMTYPVGHSEVVKRFNNLATLFLEFDHLEDAEGRFRDALAAKVQAGASEQELFKVKSNLAVALMLQGYLEAADLLTLEVLSGRLKYETRIQDVARAYHQRAAFLHISGRLEEADVAVREALGTRRNLSHSDMAVASSLNLLAKILADQGEVEEALETVREALEIREARLEEGAKAIAQSRRVLAELRILENPEQARELLSQTRATFERINPKSWRIADIDSLLGELAMRDGNFEKARRLLRESYEKLREIRGEDATVTKKANARLLKLEQADESED